MPTPRLQQITAWSHSRYTTYETCPQKAKFQVIDKLREPDSPAGLRGTRVHLLAAAWVTKQMPKLDSQGEQFRSELKKVLASKTIPEELNTFTEEFKILRALKPVPRTEQEWAFTKDWSPTSWFGAQTWLRVKVDLEYLETRKRGPLRDTTVIIRDYKTGKKKEDEHAMQRSLYALGGLLMYPDAARVVVAHWYLDQGIEDVQEWSSSELDSLKTEWLKRTKAMLTDTTYAPKPSPQACQWCHFRKANDGPCKY